MNNNIEQKLNDDTPLYNVECGDFLVNIANGEATIAKCLKSHEEIIMPSFISDIPITSIESFAFSNAKASTSDEIIKKIVLPEKLRSLKPFALDGCFGIEELIMPDTLESISYNMFSGFMSLKKIKLPRDLSELSFGLFGYCLALEKIELPKNLTKIGKSSFEGCSSLTEITLPESISEIAEGAFKDCVNLKTVNLPKNLTKIGKTAFEGCANLADENGFVIYGGFMFDYLGDEKNIVIPAGIVDIWTNVFKDNTEITSVTFAYTTRYVCPNAFSNCTNLKTVKIYNVMCEFSKGAFSNTPSFSLSDMHSAIFTSLSLFEQIEKCRSIFKIWTSLSAIKQRRVISLIKRNKDLQIYLFTLESADIVTHLLRSGRILELDDVYIYLDQHKKEKKTELITAMLNYISTEFTQQELDDYDNSMMMVDLDLELPTVKQMKRNWSLTLTGNSIYIHAYIGSDTTATIPAKTKEGFEIVGIKSSARDSFKKLETLKIADSVKEIPDIEFLGCKNIKKVCFD